MLLVTSSWTHDQSAPSMSVIGRATKRQNSVPATPISHTYTHTRTLKQIHRHKHTLAFRFGIEIINIGDSSMHCRDTLARTLIITSARGSHSRY